MDRLRFPAELDREKAAAGRMASSRSGSERAGSRSASSGCAISAATMSPFTTIPVTTTPRQKMGKMYSNMSVLSGRDGVGEEDDANADPKSEDAGHPKADEHAVVTVHEEPERNARDQTDEGGQEKGPIGFVKHIFGWVR